LFEIEYKSRFDHILINDSLEKALAEAEKIVTDFLAL
jgi:guanylate kinase